MTGIHLYTYTSSLLLHCQICWASPLPSFIRHVLSCLSCRHIRTYLGMPGKARPLREDLHAPITTNEAQECQCGWRKQSNLFWVMCAQEVPFHLTRMSPHRPFTAWEGALSCRHSACRGTPATGEVKGVMGNEKEDRRGGSTVFRHCKRKKLQKGRGSLYQGVARAPGMVGTDSATPVVSVMLLCKATEVHARLLYSEKNS